MLNTAANTPVITQDALHCGANLWPMGVLYKTQGSLNYTHTLNTHMHKHACTQNNSLSACFSLFLCVSLLVSHHHTVFSLYLDSLI